MRGRGYCIRADLHKEIVHPGVLVVNHLVMIGGRGDNANVSAMHCQHLSEHGKEPPDARPKSRTAVRQE